MALALLLVPNYPMAGETSPRTSQDICDLPGCHGFQYDEWVTISSYDIPASISQGASDTVTADVEVTGRSNWASYEWYYEAKLTVYCFSSDGKVTVGNSPQTVATVTPTYGDQFSFDTDWVAGGSDTSTTWARENLSDISLDVDDGLAGRPELSVEGIGDLDVGSASDVELTNPGKKGASGRVDLEWTGEDGDADRHSMRVEHYGDQGRGGGSGKGARSAGRIIGWICLVLLVMSIVLGGFPRRSRSRLSKWIGSAKRRVRIHCSISYGILLLTLIHAVVLMFGHWDYIVAGNFFLWAQTSYASGIYINLGTISLVLMTFVGLSGALQKRFIKAMGPKPWRYSHLILSLAALILVIVHAVMVGTSFKHLFG